MKITIKELKRAVQSVIKEQYTGTMANTFESTDIISSLDVEGDDAFIQQLKAAGFTEAEEHWFHPQHWRIAKQGDAPDFWSYEAEFVALSKKAKRIAQAA